MAGSSQSPEVVAGTPAIDPLVAAERGRVSLLDRMRDELAKEPKREVKVRSDGDVFVQINGYTFIIQPGLKVKVPESVAVLLENADYI